ncbi:RidA family protein [Micromonospora sp. NPDC005686]|uniref:RidA family protein n=1 Tax=unclassified Micromonospora TaxID=2617518 RepID=UPI0033AE06CF
MNFTNVDPPHLVDPGLSQGALVTGAQRLLFITGQAPLTADEAVPEGFEAQCRLVWSNVLAVLHEAGMTVENLVKVTTYLADRSDREVNSKIRQEMLGGHRPALGIIITGCWDESWLLEIEAIAAA